MQEMHELQVRSLGQEDSLEQETATQYSFSIPVFLPGKSHRQMNLAGYSTWGHCRESDSTEQLSTHKYHVVQQLRVKLSSAVGRPEFEFFPTYFLVLLALSKLTTSMPRFLHMRFEYKSEISPEVVILRALNKISVRCLTLCLTHNKHSISVGRKKKERK